jgi:hypothetical protein
MGGKLVLRSNWEIYCKEMVLAVKGILETKSIPGLTCTISEEQLNSDPRIGRDVTTHFERKYAQAGQALYQASFDLGVRSKEQRLSLLRGIPQGRSYDSDHEEDASSTSDL